MRAHRRRKSGPVTLKNQSPSSGNTQKSRSFFFVPRDVNRIVRPRGSWGTNILCQSNRESMGSIEARNRAGIVGPGTRERARTTAKQPTIDEREIVYVEVRGFNFKMSSVD